MATYEYTSWPFHISQRRFDAIDPRLKGHIDAILEVVVVQWEEKNKSARIIPFPLKPPRSKEEA